MRKWCIAVLGAALLVLGAGPAFAWDEEPVAATQACGEGQGWNGTIGIRSGPRAGQYAVSVFSSTDSCTAIEVAQFKAIGRRYIRTGSVVDLADPAVWTVTIF